MTALPRLLVVMGSGETSPTMVKTHRDVLGRLGPPPVPAVVLDTPFGFQENADELTARAQAYFRDSVGHELGVAGFRDAAAATALETETMLARLREARYVFAGPGSPSYALRQWRGTPVHDVLAAKLRAGGAVVFASAAALTLGRFTIPVYEVYKVGETPRWLDGLDLLAEAGLCVAVVPHFNNAEGGTHDTRYCYMGERRLRALEAQLPADAVVLGVDEHTACVIDLDAGTGAVAGVGLVTVRAGGRSVEVPSGESFPLALLGDVAAGRTAGGRPAPAPRPAAADGAGAAGDATALLPEEVAGAERDFDAGLGAGDATAAVEAVLALDSTIARWSTETFSADEMDRALAARRGMIVRLGEAAAGGLRDPREVVGPFVEALLSVRRDLRTAGEYTAADAIRDRLAGIGVEVRDAPGGPEWEMGAAT